VKQARKNGLLDRLMRAGSRTTYRRSPAPSGKSRKSATAQPVRYRGVEIIPVADGEYTISIDRDSRFESLKDAKAVIRRFAKNPSKFQKCVDAAAGRKKYGAAEMRRRAIAGRKRKRNPDDELQAAARLSEEFHGRPARTVRELEQIEHSRDTLADLGRLISFTVWLDEDKPVELEFRGVRLACSPDGGQLYLTGNQRLDLAALGLNRYLPKDHITVGLVESVVYHTSKAFHNFEPIEYEHTFGEEGGELPTLGYDVLSEKFYLTGGSYQVKPEGIVN